MATIFEDSFNSYNDGNLHGQGSWSGNTGYKVQGTTVYEGAKAVNASMASGNDWIIAKTGDATDDGKFTIYIRSSNVSYGQGVFRLYEGSVQYTDLQFRGATIKIYNWTTSSDVNLKTDAVANVWYQVETEWRSSDNKYRARLDGGTWTDWVGASGNRVPDKIHINVWASGGAADMLFDYIAENPYVAGTNIKINIGDTFKSVDSIKINVGDSWKSVTSIKQNIADVWKNVF